MALRTAMMKLGELMGFCCPIAATSLHAHMAFQGDVAEKGIFQWLI
jgi:hypothetical protein